MPALSLFDRLTELPDPRHRKGRQYPLVSLLGLALVAILGVSVLLHYFLISFTALPAESPLRLEAYKAAFNAWLPVASGLVSAAVTYYFTRDRDDKK